ncbi:NUDIX domain-containing protein [Kitasatospora sp. RG8]|uniref:NUDIX hydrolase n=1 Tax=Kitasatospora sp. RG8 TaxID=2820815 RepID=UPI001FD7AC2E|nr:NUDIX hydrolase [Kitasatospora sp. RG8]
MDTTGPTTGALVADRIGRILLLRRSDGCWELPTVAQLPGEEPADAATRALYETCGRPGTADRTVGELDGGDGLARQLVVRVAPDDPGDLDRLVLTRHATHGWFFADSLPGVTPAAVAFLRAHAPARPYLPREHWLATTSRSWTCTAALLTAPDGRLLMVRGDDVDRWGFPGGVLDNHEHSRTGAERELREETGLDLPAGPLLAVFWQHPAPGLDHPLVQFVHDFGTLDPDSVQLSCADGEITHWAWIAPDELDAAAGPSRGERARLALRARGTGRTVTDTCPGDFGGAALAPAPAIGPGRGRTQGLA